MKASAPVQNLADLTVDFPLHRTTILCTAVIAVNPVVLGEGTPLFKPHAGRRELRLLGTRVFTSGIVELRYAQAEA